MPPLAGLTNFIPGRFQGLASLATRLGPSGARCTGNSLCSSIAKSRGWTNQPPGASPRFLLHLVLQRSDLAYPRLQTSWGYTAVRCIICSIRQYTTQDLRILVMQPHEIAVEPDGSNDSGRCSCCGSMSRTIWGYLRHLDIPIAVYYVHWTLGRIDHAQSSILSWANGERKRRQRIGLWSPSHSSGCPAARSSR